MSMSSQPVKPGFQFPDARQPTTKVEVPDARLPGLVSGHPVHRDNPFNAASVTTPFLEQHLQENAYEPIKRIIYNRVELQDGWQFVAARPKVMEYNQIVELVYYERRPMPELPEDVPAPILKSTKESYKTEMDQHKLQFEMEGAFLTYGAELAAEMHANYSACLISSMNITWKQKITFAYMTAKQEQWIRAAKVDNPRDYSDISNWELTTYGQLDMNHKGLPAMMNYVRQLTKMEDFTFNMAVLPFGRLDRIAMNPYFSEAWRAGPDAIKNLLEGGKRLTNMIDGITFYEDAKWSFKNLKMIEEEAFVHRVTRGGWCYNNGDAECEDDDDPNCKYGFQFIVKGDKNWHTKKFLDLLKESGRYGPTGDMDPYIFTLCDNWEEICRAAQVYPYNGRLDPQAYRVDNQFANNDRVIDRYLPARRFGEVDPAYSPLECIRKHVRKMQSLIRSKMNPMELMALSKLETIKNTLGEVTEFPLCDYQEGFLAAVAIQNSPDTFTWVDDVKKFAMNTDNISVFLETDPFNKAPKKIPRIKKLPEGFPPELAGGQQYAMVVEIKNVDHYIFTIKYDTPLVIGPNRVGRQRGPTNKVFGYVAIPENGRMITNFDAYRNMAQAGHKWDALYGAFADAGDEARVGFVPGDNPEAGSFVNPELYNESGNPVNGESCRYAFRPTSDVLAALESMSAAREGGDEARAILAGLAVEHYTRGTGDVSADVPTQGFKMPSITPPPEVPFFYGGINGLRYLANLKKNASSHGWSSDLMNDIYEGVKALDIFFNIMLNIHTPRNIYFDPGLVPFHLQTEDPDLNRLNTAIAGLWQNQDKPFLTRRPFRLKPAAGNMFFPRSFVDWSRGESKTQWYYDSTKLFNKRFGTAFNGDDVSNAAEDYYGDEADDDNRDAYTKIFAFNSVLDSGLLTGRVREVLVNDGRWDEFNAAYSSGAASFSYAMDLKSRKRLVYGTTAEEDLRDFQVLYENELQPYLDDAAKRLKNYFDNSNPGMGGDRAARLAASSITENELHPIVNNLVIFARLLTVIIGLFLDDSEGKMEYNLTGAILNKKKTQVTESAVSVKTSSGLVDVDIIKKSLKNALNEAKDAFNEPASEAAGAQTSRYWINTGLHVSKTLWTRMSHEIANLERIISTGRAPEKIFDLAYAYNTPLRPMMGEDHGKPLAGEPILESQYSVGNAGQVAGYAKKIAENMSQAMHKKANEGLERFAPSEPSYLSSEKLKSRRFDVEEIARKISNNRFEPASKRTVPVEFMNRDPYRDNSRRNDSYLAGIRVQTDTSGVVEEGIEPQHLKWRLNEINKFYKDDTISRIIAHLWCFAPFHFEVISNMVANLVTPAGTGLIQLRWAQVDRMGAVLFTIGNDRNVAESGYNCSMSSAAYNQQHNKYNVVFSAFLGCTIYQQNKVLWLRSQTMHGNISGMGDSVYVDPQSFDPSRALKPDKDAFVVYVGDNLPIDEIKQCISITSKYNDQRYGQLVNNKAILETKEQHVPGLLYLIGKFRLYELNSFTWNQKSNFYEEKVGSYVNTDCYKEDQRHWNSKTKSYSNRVIGKWHLSELDPTQAEFLEGRMTMDVGRTSFDRMRY